MKWVKKWIGAYDSPLLLFHLNVPLPPPSPPPPLKTTATHSQYRPHSASQCPSAATRGVPQPTIAIARTREKVRAYVCACELVWGEINRDNLSREMERNKRRGKGRRRGRRERRSKSTITCALKPVKWNVSGCSSPTVALGLSFTHVPVRSPEELQFWLMFRLLHLALLFVSLPSMLFSHTEIWIKMKIKNNFISKPVRELFEWEKRYYHKTNPSGI